MVQPYYAQRKMPIDVGSAKMDYPSFYTGRESQAVAEFAKAFGGTADLAVKRLNSIAQTEYTTGKAEWETAHNIFLDDLREDPDSDNYIKKYDAYSKKVQKDILATKSEVSKKHLSEMFKSKTPSVKKAIGDIAWERKQGVLGADVLTAVRSHELSGNSSAAEAALIEAVNAGILEPKFAANRAMQIKRNVDWNNGYQMAGSDPEGLLKIIDGGFFPNLDKQDLEQLRSRAETSLARNTAVEKEQLEIQREADRDVISKAIQNADPNINETIDGSSLDEAEQWTWNERAKARLKGIPTDPKVRWDTLRKLTKDPKSVTDEYLESMIDKGLTWEDAEEFKKIRDAETDPMKSPRAQLYFNRLDSLYTNRDEDEEEAYEWDIANEKLMAYFKANPDTTAQQTQEFYNELTDEKKRGLLDRIVNPIGWKSGTVASLILEWARGGKKGELPKPKTQKEFEDTVRMLDEEDAKKYYDKWKSIIWR